LNEGRLVNPAQWQRWHCNTDYVTDNGKKMLITTTGKHNGHRGVATSDRGYIPPKSVQVNFLWGKNDVKAVIEHEY